MRLQQLGGKNEHNQLNRIIAEIQVDGNQE